MRAFTATRFFHAALLALAATVAARASAWHEVTPEDLAATQCASDPNAPAEILYKELLYDSSGDGVRTIMTRVVTKIYAKSALDEARRTKIWYSPHYLPNSVRARVVKPDGSFVEIDRSGVVEQVESKRGRQIYRSMTLAMPQVEVGDIVEYQYRMSLRDGYYLPKDEIAFQEDWPIRKLYLRITPEDRHAVGFKWISNRIDKRLKKVRGGHYEVTLENQPAYPREPFQAPDSDGRAWFAFYNVSSTTTGDAFWRQQGQSLHRKTLLRAKSDAVVAAKAAELAHEKNSQEEKLRAFYDFCRSALINSEHGRIDRLTEDQLEELDEDWSASKTLDKGYGTPTDINVVFCALSRAAKIDARLARCADHRESTFIKAMENADVSLPATLVAIQDGGEWFFYNPGARYAPFGELDWYHTDAGALVADPKTLIFEQTQSASPKSNVAKTFGRFELSESGEITGRVVLSSEGNHSLQLKQLLDDQSEGERVESVRLALASLWPNAQIRGIQIHNADDPFEPIKIECAVTIPSYAERVGSRLFLQPNVEARYAKPIFPSPTRKTDIYFEFKRREESEIIITLPDGYELEDASAPVPFTFEGFMTYDPALALRTEPSALVYHRAVEYHGHWHSPKTYAAMKRAFDELLSRDQHTVTLKKTEAVETAQEPAGVHPSAPSARP